MRTSRAVVVASGAVLAVAAVLVVLVAVLPRLRSAPSAGVSAAVAPGLSLPGHRGAPGERSWTAWPQALHDAQHSGASPYEGPVTGRVRWRRHLEGHVTPGPVIGADNTVYAASDAGVLHALNPADGTDLWTFAARGDHATDPSTSPAVLPNGIVLWPAPGGSLDALSRAGRLLWRLRLDGRISSPAVNPDGLTVVGSSDGRLVALRPSPSGAHVQWMVDLREHSFGSPVLSPDGATAYQSVLSGVVAVRRGRLLWRSTAPRAIVEVSPAVGPDGTVVIGTNDPFEYGLSPVDGHVTWRYRRSFWTYSSPGVTRDGIVYFGDHANRVTGLDVRTGQRLFQYRGTRRRAASRSIGIWTAILVDAQHRAYAGTRQGLIYGVDRDGRLLWQLHTGATVESYPALTADGALILGRSDGWLMAIADR